MDIDMKAHYLYTSDTLGFITASKSKHMKLGKLKLYTSSLPPKGHLVSLLAGLSWPRKN